MPPDDAWTAYEALGHGNRLELTAAQQAVFAICDLRQEVNSGGFDAYFRYRGADTAEVAVAALPSVLGDAWANLLREVMQVFGPDFPADPSAREELLDASDLDDAMNDYDARFYELEGSTDADRAVNSYLLDDDSE